MWPITYAVHKQTNYGGQNITPSTCSVHGGGNDGLNFESEVNGPPFSKIQIKSHKPTIRSCLSYECDCWMRM